MAENASSFLTPWSSFYVMTGSSAAALTGLMFVVITLITGVERVRRNPDGISTFSTPTVVHFCAALLISAIISAPWHSLVQPATLIGLVGLFGVVYVLRVMHRTRRLTSYSPDLEDWAWYSILPLLAYAAILAGGIMFPGSPVNALFALAAGVIFLIFIGIHNAWDIVTYIVTELLQEPPSSS
ncbi:MAG TPA: hypothetical protein VN934_03475 [Candidatus Tumulicola sp.]|nr:hypothetical protein [Candidatus Tumulicola sp.]